MNKNYDLIVLGSGMGYNIATDFKEAKPNSKVLIIDKSSFGGTCPQRGCHPKKFFFETFNTLNRANALKGQGLNGSFELDLETLMKRTSQYTDKIDGGSKEDFDKLGIDYINSSAKFINENTIEVDNKQISSEKFVVATGSSTRKLGIPGEEYAINSDDFFKQKSLPKNMLFIGSGYISLEFGSMASVTGTNVKMLEFGTKVLPMFDSQSVNYLLNSLKKRNLDIEFSKEVIEIQKKDDMYIVKTKDGNEYKTDLVFNGAGRPPNGHTFGAENAGIELSKNGGVIVNEFLQTTNPRVYAAGDVVSGSAALTPVGGLELEIVRDNLIADKNISKINYGSVPSVLFTIPQLASVGISEDIIKKESKQDEYDIVYKELEDNLSSKSKNLYDLSAKFIVEKSTGNLVGAHIVGHQAEDLANLYALAINNHVKASNMWNSTIQAYPTLSYTMNQLLKK